MVGNNNKPLMTYRPDIDGLRAFAVLSVLFYHAHLGFSGGYVGVDVFFVISGFLITGLLVKSISAGTFSYADFWERRVRRLVPALAVVTLLTSISSYFILMPNDLVDLGKALIAQPLLLVNVYFWRAVQGGYFGDPPETRPLLHTWSLGVEEQFYVLFPVLLVLIYSQKPLVNHVGKLLCAFAFASLLLSIFLTPIKGVAAFFLLPTRAWELILGGLLVFTPRRAFSIWSRQSMCWTGLAFIAYATFFFDAGTRFPGSAALVPCVGTALVIFANSQGTLTGVGTLLAHPLLLRIGRMSYSLYLWHWPLMAYGDYTGLTRHTEARWLVLLLSFWLGYLSWRWVETPIREKKWLSSRKAIWFFFLAYAGLSAGVGAGFWFASGFPQHWSDEAKQLAADTNADFRVRQADLTKPISQLESIGKLTNESTTYLVWGDSHARSLTPLLDEMGRDYHLKGVCLIKNGMAPLLQWQYTSSSALPKISFEDKERWAEYAIKTVKQHDVTTVFLVGFWEVYSRPSLPEEIELTVRRLVDLGVTVILVCDNPKQSGQVPRLLAISTKWPLATPLLTDEVRHTQRNKLVYQSVKRLAVLKDFHTVDLAALILQWDTLSMDGRSSYLDDNHLSIHGAAKMRPLFEPIFQRMRDTLNSRIVSGEESEPTREK